MEKVALKHNEGQRTISLHDRKEKYWKQAYQVFEIFGEGTNVKPLKIVYLRRELRGSNTITIVYSNFLLL